MKKHSRDHIIRYKNKYVKKWEDRLSWMFWTSILPEDWIALESKKRSKTRHPCSCWGCGNQRKLKGQTRQEVLANGE